MDLDLYDMDLSLFDRDLLVGLEPTSAELKLSQDVSKSAYTSDGTVWQTKCSEVALGFQEGTTCQILAMPGEDGGSSSWMEADVDLLELLTEQQTAVTPVMPEMSITAVTQDCSNQVVSAIDILQSVADETVDMLTSGNAETMQPITDEVCQTVDEHVLQKPSPVEDPLLDMLSMDVDCSVNVDLTLQSGSFDLDILSPVTAEDVESILSSGPSSPVPLDHSNLSDMTSLSQNVGIEELPDLLDTSSIMPDISDLSSGDEFQSDEIDYFSEYHVNTSRGTPYSKADAKVAVTKSKSKNPVDKAAREAERKLRKKQQNKNAALRYRQKKRSEQDVADQECDELELRNKELRDKVEQMTGEIGYLKNLLAEVFQAKGMDISIVLKQVK